MPRLLALEWNADEARVAVANTRGDETVVEHAFSVDLRPDEAVEGEQPAVDAGARIAVALSARHLSRLDTLVAIGRTNIELRKLSLPPVPDDELPELVRFQALREFNALDASWPVDFIPIDDATDQARSVLAAAIDPEMVEQVRQTCGAAGLKPRRLILRPCAAASLLCRTGGESLRQVTLLVDLLVGEADLTVVCDRQVVFLRTARLPGDPLADESTAGALVSELRRTVAAAQNQLGGRRIESITLCGSGERHAELAERIHQQFSLPTELFNPFKGIDLSVELRQAPPDGAGRFAPLLGALLDEMEQAPHAIDFLHPRRPPPPPSRRKLYAGVGLGFAVLVAAAVVGGSLYGKQLQKEIDDLGTRSSELDKSVAEATQVRTAAKEIEKWGDSDFCWLNELNWLSEKFPPAQEAMLTELQMQPRLRGGKVVGQLDFKGLAQDVGAIKAGEERLRDDQHDVIGGQATEEKTAKSYAWRFGSVLYVDREAK